VCIYVPMQFGDTPVKPFGQGGHTDPIPGAGISKHGPSLKHSLSTQPSRSNSQNLPSHAAIRKRTYYY